MKCNYITNKKITSVELEGFIINISISYNSLEKSILSNKNIFNKNVNISKLK